MGTPHSDQGTIEDIGKWVFGDEYEDFNNGFSPVSFEEAVLETVAVIGGWRKYSVGVRWSWTAKASISGGVGAKFDARLGWDLCNGGWNCVGVDGGVKKGVKMSGKLFVCAKQEGDKQFLKIEVGMSNIAAEVVMTFVSGVGPVGPPKFTPSNIRSHVVVSSCMAEPSWKSDTQRTDDGWCPLKQDSSECNAHSLCYWGKPSDRKKYCFATKAWKDKHPRGWHGKKDGLCPAADSAKNCMKHLHCVWDYDPCNAAPCKSMEYIIAQYLELKGQLGGFNMLRDVAAS